MRRRYVYNVYTQLHRYFEYNETTILFIREVVLLFLFFCFFVFWWGATELKNDPTFSVTRQLFELQNTCRRLYCVLIFNFHFCSGIFSLFYMWLRVLRSWKVTIYRDGDNIIIIIVGFLV